MTDRDDKIGRRGFVGGALGAAAGVGVTSMLGQNTAEAQPAGGPPEMSPNFVRPTSSFKLEATIYDCDVEGEIPSDLNGAFYRVGPDAQYPLAPGNIPFDGEGHVSMFRIRNGRCDYRTRFVKNDRWLAQNEAGRVLFPMYRNPDMDDPSVAGLSRSTANTPGWNATARPRSTVQRSTRPSPGNVPTRPRNCARPPACADGPGPDMPGRPAT